MPQVELAPRALRHIRRLGALEQRRVRRAVENLAAGAEHLDIRPLAGRHPWQRLRVGDYRILFRPLTVPGTARRGVSEDILVVARVIHRSQLERAVRRL